MNLFPRASCAEVGLDPQAVIDFCDAAAAEPLELHCLVIVRRGAAAVSAAWAPYTTDRATLVYSVTKSLVGTAAGLAIGEGKLALDTRLVDLFADEVPERVHPRTAELTLHHVLSMSTGHTEDTLLELRTLPPAEWVRGFLSMPPQREVGSLHIYHNGASWIAGEAVRRATGEGLVEWLMPRVLEPLSIEDLPWRRDELGREFGHSGAYLTAERAAALGHLYLRGGLHQGRRLLPEGWVDLATRAHIPTPGNVNPHSCCGYGYQLWRNREGYRFDGHNAQYTVVLPERDAVISLTSGQWPTVKVLETVWRHLLPGFDRAETPGSRQRLEQRLGELEIPLPTERTTPEARDRPGPVAVLRVDPEEAEWQYPRVADVSLTPAGEGWELAFTNDDGRVRLPCGADTWVESVLEQAGAEVPVAVRAWTGPHEHAGGGVHVDVSFVRTPHRLHLHLGESSAAPEARATMQWSGWPLHSPRMIELGLPR